MFSNLLRQQARGVENLMRNQPVADPKLMDEAISDIATAVAKAEQAVKGVSNGSVKSPTN